MPFRYAGGDLHEAADLAGLSVEALVAWHTTGRRTCRFIGFTPGFGYLTADEPGPVIPRRSRSRTRIPAGSVALADRYSAVYPRDSPGGWQLIGTTDAALWDLDRPEPALLRPGTPWCGSSRRDDARGARDRTADHGAGPRSARLVPRGGRRLRGR